jgi:predicted transcriptional regulator
MRRQHYQDLEYVRIHRIREADVVYPNDTAAFVKETRAILGISIYRLSKFLEVGRKLIGKWERGELRPSPPAMLFMQKIRRYPEYNGKCLISKRLKT